MQDTHFPSPSDSSSDSRRLTLCRGTHGNAKSTIQICTDVDKIIADDGSKCSPDYFALTPRQKSHVMIAMFEQTLKAHCELSTACCFTWRWSSFCSVCSRTGIWIDSFSASRLGSASGLGCADGAGVSLLA